MAIMLSLGRLDSESSEAWSDASVDRVDTDLQFRCGREKHGKKSMMCNIERQVGSFGLAVNLAGKKSRTSESFARQRSASAGDLSHECIPQLFTALARRRALQQGWMEKAEKLPRRAKNLPQEILAKRVTDVCKVELHTWSQLPLL